MTEADSESSEFMEKTLKVILSWSSGKDSVWTLHLLRQRTDIYVAALLTTFTLQRTAWPCMRSGAG